MNRWRRTRATTSVLAFVALVGLSALMLVFRGRLDKAHVALLYLLVVLGGSAVGGRKAGLTLGAGAFLLFDFLFLRPYYTFTIADPLDWLVLITFLATSIVATQLFERQRRQTALADARRAELDQLATLGAETLNAARAEHALAAIAQVIRSSVGVGRCELFVRSEVHGLSVIADSDLQEGLPAAAEFDAGDLLEYILATGRTAIARADGTVHLVADSPDDGRSHTVVEARAFAIPLSVRGQTVGVLRIRDQHTFMLSRDQQRVLNALAYYAALGIDRLRLERAEHTAEELRRVDRLKDALLAAVSHDLRTPLTTIKGIAHEITATGISRAHVIEDEADRLSALVEGLLELSQLNAGALPMDRAFNTADDLIGAALQRASAILRIRRVDVDLGTGDVLVGQFDFVHSLRILVNLLENAVKYSPDDTPICITAGRHGNRLEISVADRGPGIPTSERQRIFEPFYRTPGTAADIRGAGLGLSIAKRLAQAQAGDLHVATRDGGGSVFTIVLPAGDVPSPNPAVRDAQSGLRPPL